MKEFIDLMNLFPVGLVIVKNYLESHLLTIMFMTLWMSQVQFIISKRK